MYFDMTKYDEAIAVYKSSCKSGRTLPRRHPAREDHQGLRARPQPGRCGKEREVLGRTTARAAMVQSQPRQPEALAVAAQLAEDALLSAATSVHAAAQACKAKNQGDKTKLEECLQTYRTAAELYEKY